MDFKKAKEEVKKVWGGSSIQSLSNYTPIQWPVIPTGSYNLNKALYIGGWPRKRIVELYGSESTGKTTLALQACIEAQKMGLIACYVDMENTVSIDYGRELGLDISDEKFSFSQPDSGEEALGIVSKLLECEDVGIIVLDTVASLITHKEIECDSTETTSQMGSVPRFLGFMLRQINPKMSKSNAVMMFLNQVRPSIGVQSYIPVEHTPGGRALTFYSSVRVCLKHGVAIKTEDETIGTRVNVSVSKNKLAPPKVKTWLEIRYGKGLNTTVELFEWGVENGLITKEGQSYNFDGLNLGRGKDSAVEQLKESGKELNLAKLMMAS